jgi:hypothetical protein
MASMINNKMTSGTHFRGIADHHIHARTDEREVIARVIIRKAEGDGDVVPAIIRVLARD